ncbi:hypothetical protein BmR1_04g05030 [Babesia microti strain RI]|uniref:Uncharacterized protein n=1 Tax=Babesia microti (strain RI) TaxID=1133968 RepID=I7JCI0_BABMR|nr:hypothetical protein BmR1_04g05030 [Babesia microti strain RI]CCF75205.1 hypothetical protein BmR1_04g05030 [Babesia microti strain RI]|eukprot:XP_012649613.1 hypothetical protein BmR1_04g05030 [Babesia microti strain RI]
MLPTYIAGTSNSSEYCYNPACVLSNRYGINAIDIKNDILITGDNMGYISTWDLDLQSQMRSTKLDTGIINVKFANNCLVSQSKEELALLTVNVDTFLKRTDSKSCTFARFVLLGDNSIIAHPNPQIHGDISIISSAHNNLTQIYNIKITTDKNLGSLHVLKGITDLQFIASYEIGSLFTFDIRKLDSPITDPIYISTTAPIHSVEFFNGIIYAGTAEGELYSANGGNVDKCYAMKSYSQPANVGIGNILKYKDLLILTCWDGTVRVLDPVNFAEKIIFHGHSSTVTDLAVDTTNDVLFTSGIDGRICIWDTKLIKRC